MPATDPNADVSFANGTRHQVVSAIPRPASGTSRRAVSVRRSSKSCLTTTPLLSPDKARRRPQRRSLTIESEASPVPHHLPRSLLPRYESILDGLQATEDESCVSKRPLTKSQTVPALPSPTRDVMSHSLMRPLPPPLPRSTTYDDLASPKFKLRLASESFGQPPLLTDEQTDWQRIGSHEQRPPKVSKSDTRHSLAHSNTATNPNSYLKSGRTRTEDSFVKHEVDPRLVFVPETARYWLGRYSSTLDRLRSDKLLHSQKAPKPIRQPKDQSAKSPTDSIELDREETAIKREALQRLRAFCRTKAALESFQMFERSLCIRDADLSTPSMRRSETARFFTSRSSLSMVPNPPVNPAKPKMRKLSDRSLFRKGSATVSVPKLEKSVTISNFGSTDSFSTAATSQGSQWSRPSQGSFPAQQRHESASLQSVDSGNRALINRNDRPSHGRPSMGTTEVQNPLSFRHLQARQSIQNKVTSPLEADPTCNKANADKVVVSGTESLHVAKPVFNRNGAARATSGGQDNAEQPISGMETAPSSGSRRFRKSESMKKLVDAGFREIKKMGHRVSNVSGHDGNDEYQQ